MDNIKYFDIHSHLNFKDFDENRDEIIDEMKKENIATIAVGTSQSDSLEVVELAQKYENIFACIGVHPADDSIFSEFDKKFFDDLAKNKKVVAIGECGLDYFRDQNEDLKEKQKEIFVKHVELAIENDLPLMIHARPTKNTMNAYEDVLDILESYKQKSSSLFGNFHFFVGDLNIAKRALSIGFTMSFDGPITFARDYDEVIKFLPIESIMAETDSPFASPIPFRGKTNNPTNVKFIYEKIAEIRGEDIEIVRNKINENARRVFRV